MSTTRRFPRERFTRALTAICERVAAAPVRALDYSFPMSDRWHAGVSGELRVEVRGIWAFGSWSRGAIDCGDLDLMADIDYCWSATPVARPEWGGQGGLPTFDAVCRQALGSWPHVHVVSMKDVRESKSFAASEREAKLIWGPGLDWRTHIADIRPDPSATRAPRLSDQLPLRVSQTAMSLGDVEKAVYARNVGLLEWEFAPHGASRLEGADLDSAEQQIERMERSCSDRLLVRRAVKAARAVREQMPGGVKFWFGNNCGVWPGMFRDVGTKAIVITPKWSETGPNGSLIVRRGPKFSIEGADAFDVATLGNAAVPEGWLPLEPSKPPPSNRRRLRP